MSTIPSLSENTAPDGTDVIYSTDGTNDEKVQIKNLLKGSGAEVPAAKITGTVAHEQGGLEADVSAYSGLVKITGGATSAVADPNATATTKGDLLVRGASALGRVAVGTNDQVLTADSAEASGVKWADAGGGGGGKLLQVAFGAYAIQRTHTSTYADTGLSASITVSAADSNVLIFVAQNVGENGYAFHADLQIMRDTTVVKEFKKAFFDEDSVTFATVDNVALNTIDIAPGIGTYTYKTQCKEVSGDVRTQYTGGGTSTIILMEIGA